MVPASMQGENRTNETGRATQRGLKGGVIVQVENVERQNLKKKKKCRMKKMKKMKMSSDKIKKK
jgi:hypothetical protein